MDVPEIPNWMTLGGGVVSLGGFLLIAYWFLNHLKDERKERQEIEARREAARIAHEAKRDETLTKVTDTLGERLDRNSECWIRAESVMRRCEERHEREDRAKPV